MNRSILQIYVKNCDEAFEFYKLTFNAEVGFQDFDDQGNLIHRELNLNGQTIAIGEIGDKLNISTTGNVMRFCIQFDQEQREV